MIQLIPISLNIHSYQLELEIPQVLVFGSEFNGSNVDIKFFPERSINVTVQTHSEIIQTTSDLVNIPDILSYEL